MPETSLEDLFTEEILKDSNLEGNCIQSLHFPYNHTFNIFITLDIYIKINEIGMRKLKQYLAWGLSWEKKGDLQKALCYYGNADEQRNNVLKSKSTLSPSIDVSAMLSPKCTSFQVENNKKSL